MLARSVKQKFPQLSPEDALRAVETAVSQKSGSQEKDIRQAISMLLPMEPSKLQKILSQPDRSPILGSIVQQLFRSGDFENLEPSVIRSTVLDVIKTALERLPSGTLKNESLTLHMVKQLSQMIVAEVKKRNSSVNHTLHESRSLSDILFG